VFAFYPQPYRTESDYLQVDGVEVPLCFETAIYAWINKGCIITEESEDVIASITIDNQLQ